MSKIGLYLRLSVEEHGTDESNSITNQRYLLNAFLDQTTDYQSFQREEFVDDGFSGTSTNRPAFQRLMTAIKSGAIRCIIVKDFSRFMRDYLELGNYLENIFPFLGVRFIAVNDQYDSLTSGNNGIEMDVSFRNLLNDFYAKDVSEKVKSAMNTMKRSGKNMSWLPPFGYLKEPNDRFKIVPDEATAPIVQRIFLLCIEGMGTHCIAKLLNEENTITPAERKMQVSQARYQKSIILTEEQQRNIWTKNSVRQILKNEAYKGTYLFNTRTYIGGKHVKRPESEWERIENNHEPLISVDEFEQAQQVMASRFTKRSSKAPTKEQDNLLRGLVICEHCGHRLLLSKSHNDYHYFHCRYCKSQGHQMTSCRLDKIAQTILETNEQDTASHTTTCSKTTLTYDKERLKQEKLSYYQAYKENEISREDYITKKEEIDARLVELDINLQTMDKPHVALSKGLTRAVVENHVEKVIVDCLGFYKIIYK